MAKKIPWGRLEGIAPPPPNFLAVGAIAPMESAPMAPARTRRWVGVWGSVVV